MIKGLDRIAANVARVRREYTSRFREIVRAASDDMIATAAGATPPLNGEDRGKNTVTGNLAAHWQYAVHYEPNGARVSLINDMSYASYVDRGHRMDIHFVPWLYIDGMGVIARHIPTPGEMLFGLVVGTKTGYVKGYEMTEKARQRFFTALKTAHANVMREMNGILGGME